MAWFWSCAVLQGKQGYKLMINRKFKLLSPFCSVADPDPGFGAFLTPGYKIKIRILDPDLGWTARDHISESLEKIFWVKNTVLKLFDADQDPGSKIFLSPVPGSGINILYTQHCFFVRDKQCQYALDLGYNVLMHGFSSASILKSIYRYGIDLTTRVYYTGPDPGVNIALQSEKDKVTGTGIFLTS